MGKLVSIGCFVLGRRGGLVLATWISLGMRGRKPSHLYASMHPGQVGREDLEVRRLAYVGNQTGVDVGDKWFN